jgi:nucleotide-binding universal stress UspA family protein
MYRVLLAADGNTSRVLEQAQAIAALPQAPAAVEAYILHVFDDSAAEEGSDMLDPRRIQAVTEAETYLSDRDVRVEVLSRAGDTVSTTLEVAEELDVDGIYVGGPKRSPTGKAIFGSVTQQLILNSPVPVTVTIDK